VSASTIIRGNIDDPTSVFVFPSEVTARFWCRHFLDPVGRPTLPLSRFLSWDQFKESCFIYPGEAKAVNRAARTMFLFQELKENSENPHFRQLIAPQFADRYLALLPELQRLLPSLGRVARIESVWPAFSRDKLRDLQRLAGDYREFLAASGLFEPAFERPRAQPQNNRYYLFYPELIEDYPEFEGLLKAQSAIQCVPLPPEAPGKVSIQVFDTIDEEIRATLLAVAGLLDGGTEAHDIVITVGDLEALETALLQTAELYEVPLVIHRGRFLPDFPLVRVFHRILAAVQSSFDVAAMKELLLGRALPWKQADLCRQLIRLALDSRMVRGRDQRGKDSWPLSVEASRRNGNPRGFSLSRIEGLHSSLRSGLLGIVGSESFAELKENLVSFAASFFDLACLEDEELRVFQFAVDTLEELERAGRYTSTPDSVFRLWLSYLDQCIYVAPQPAGGVPVYPFRVSGGIDPQHHFLINVSQRATSHLVRRYPFLSIHEESGLDTAQRDLSAGHLKLYCSSGRRVSFSYARRDFRGSNLPPAFFISRGVVPSPPLLRCAEDSFMLERQAWIAERPFALLPVQKSGYLCASSTGLRPGGVDATRRVLRDRRLIQELKGRVDNEEGKLQISATALQRFSLCPFSFLLERSLAVDTEQYEVTVSDAREFGILMHRVLQAFFEDLAGSGAAIKLLPENRQEYRRRMRQVCTAVCRRYRRDEPARLEPIWLEMQRRAVELALEFLDVDLQIMAEEHTEGSEIRLEAEAQRIDAVMVGKIDRIAANPTGYTLVDYKKKAVPAQEQILSPGSGSVQMPFYIYLMEKNGKPVSRAAFYSIENARYHFVLGGPKAKEGERETLEQNIEQIEEMTLRMGQRLLEGDYRIDKTGGRQCAYCHLAGICRDHYLLD